MVYSLEIARFSCGDTLTLSEIEDILDSIEDVDPDIEKIRNNLSVIQKHPGVEKIIIDLVEEEDNGPFSECKVAALFNNIDDYLLAKLSICH